jgi:hypothetical protein
MSSGLMYEELKSYICVLRICILYFWQYYGNLLRSLYLYNLGFICADQSCDIRTLSFTLGQKICDLRCIRI